MNWEKYKVATKAYIGPSILLYLVALVVIHPHLKDLILASTIQWAVFYWVTCLLQFPSLWAWLKTKLAEPEKTVEPEITKKEWEEIGQLIQEMDTDYAEACAAHERALKTKEI